LGTPEVGLALDAPTASTQNTANATVIAVSMRRGHHFSKQPQLSIHLLAGLGVKGDGHAGTTIQHLHRKRWNPQAPNLRQVHLLQAELLTELEQKGFTLQPGDMGENITTCRLDLLRLPTGTRLHLGETAVVEVTGLRNPCVQMDRFRPGLMAATLDRDDAGRLIRKAGIMSIVVEGGMVHPGDAIRVVPPEEPYRPLVAV
jgi:MOSC domain-containing protein YiiM